MPLYFIKHYCELSVLFGSREERRRGKGRRKKKRRKEEKKRKNSFGDISSLGRLRCAIWNATAWLPLAGTANGVAHLTPYTRLPPPPRTPTIHKQKAPRNAPAAPDTLPARLRDCLRYARVRTHTAFSGEGRVITMCNLSSQLPTSPPALFRLSRIYQCCALRPFRRAARASARVCSGAARARQNAGIWRQTRISIICRARGA